MQIQVAKSLPKSDLEAYVRTDPIKKGALGNKSSPFKQKKLDSPVKLHFHMKRALTQIKRGNQRDRDRERAQARAANKSKQNKDDGLTPEQRRERDVKALQEKLAKKQAQAIVGGGNKNNKKK
ncbi:hypothetical protein LIER_28973 [Lithospermum erythrorhizon]|uniref:Small EDRK-rich factor-like N-terminal domain-containing protein n=1 Tax=Lithospermum erythrorhizon TaxID=34254 RepID=A0AAV3RMG7_LITER